TLHVLEILDEEPLFLSGQGVLDERVALPDILEEVEDQLALLGVEGDDADAPPEVRGKQSPHLSDDGFGFGPVDARCAPPSALPDAVDAVELESRRAVRPHRRRGK